MAGFIDRVICLALALRGSVLLGTRQETAVSWGPEAVGFGSGWERTAYAELGAVSHESADQKTRCQSDRYVSRTGRGLDGVIWWERQGHARRIR